MRILHTSDWHVGKILNGRPRLDEHRRVLAEIVASRPDGRSTSSSSPVTSSSPPRPTPTRSRSC